MHKVKSAKKKIFLITMSILLLVAAVVVPCVFLLKSNSNKDPQTPPLNPGTRPGPGSSPGPGTPPIIPPVSPPSVPGPSASVVIPNLAALPSGIDTTKITKDSNDIYKFNIVENFSTEMGDPNIDGSPSGRETFQYNVLDNGLFKVSADKAVFSKDDLKDVVNRFTNEGFYMAGIHRIRKIYFDRWMSADPLNGGNASPGGFASPQDDTVHVFLPTNLHHVRTPRELEAVKQTGLLVLMHEYGHQMLMSAYTTDTSVTNVDVRQRFDFLETGNPDHKTITYSGLESIRSDTIGYDREAIKDFYFALSFTQRKLLKDWLGVDTTRDELWRTSAPLHLGNYEYDFDEITTRLLLQLTGRLWTNDIPRSLNSYSTGLANDYYLFGGTDLSRTPGNMDEYPFGGAIPVAHRMEWLNSTKIWTRINDGSLTDLGNVMVQFYKKLFRYDKKIAQPIVQNNELDVPFWLSETDAKKYDGVLAYDGRSYSKTPLVKLSNAFNITESHFDDENFQSSDRSFWDKQTYLAIFRNSTGNHRNMWFYKDKNNDGKIDSTEIMPIGLTERYEHTWNNQVYRSNNHIIIEPQTISVSTVKSTLVKWN